MKAAKFVVIIGPCSADNEESVCDYAGRLVKIQENKGQVNHYSPVYTNKAPNHRRGIYGNDTSARS